jgi:hypothetical protein
MSFIDEIRQMLDAFRGSDKRFFRFGASTHKYALNPSLTEEQIQAFEAKNNVRLPEDYRQFLLQLGNGGAGPYYGLYTLEEGLVNQDPDFLSRPFPYTSAWQEYPTSEESDAYIFDDLHIQGTLRLCHEGCGYYNFLVITGAERGSVWIDARVSDQGIGPLSHPVTNAPRVTFSEWYKTYWVK